MSSVTRISTPVAEIIGTSLEQLEGELSPWHQASDAQRQAATKKWQAVELAQSLLASGCHTKISGAVDGLLLRAKHTPEKYPQLYVGRNGNLIGRATFIRWCNQAKGKIENLLPNYKGSKPKQHDWAVRALHLYASAPTARNRPDCGTVAYQLEREGFGEVKPYQVRAVINRYSKAMTKYAKGRVGHHYHNQNIGRHVHRDTTVLPVGFAYTGDGHTCDVYVAHPANGKAWRPELTVWMDWRSGYVVGWFISNAESAISTVHSLSQAFTKHQHVPAYLYVDPGSGFKNKMISDGATSFCERFGIDPHFSLPGNAKGKGLIEGWWRWFEFRCGKQFETYCGKERTDNALRNLKSKLKRGDLVLPSLEEYKAAIQEYIDWYNRQYQKELKQSPAELWASLEQSEPHMSYEDMVKPQYEVSVAREQIRFKNRYYTSPVLAHFHKERVFVEVDLQDDSELTVRDANGQLICTAKLIERKPAVAASIIEDAQNKRLEAQIKRHQVHIQEKIEQARPVIDTDDFADADLFIEGEATAIDAPTPSTTIDLEDIT